MMVYVPAEREGGKEVARSERLRSGSCTGCILSCLGYFKAMQPGEILRSFGVT